jgi:hypothetical protein
MRRIIGKLLFGMGGLAAAGLLVSGCLATMVRSYDVDTKTTYDGFGRELVRAPLLVRWFAGEYEYAGMTWFLLDLLVFWMAVAVIYGLFSSGARLTRHALEKGVSKTV